MEPITRLVGVYDADGGLGREVAYWIKARLGRDHCALCDITHGTFRERSDWQSCRSALPVPFETMHRDEVPDAIAAAITTPPPYVAAETGRGVRLLLDADALAACAGSPEALIEALERSAAAAGLELSPGPETTADSAGTGAA